MDLPSCSTFRLACMSPAERPVPCTRAFRASFASSCLPVAEETVRAVMSLFGFDSGSHTLGALSLDRPVAPWSVIFRRFGHLERCKHFLRIKWHYRCLRPGRCYVLFRESVLERRPERREEISLADRCTPFQLSDGAVYHLAVTMSQGCKYAFI